MSKTSVTKRRRTRSERAATRKRRAAIYFRPSEVAKLLGLHKQQVHKDIAASNVKTVTVVGVKLITQRGFEDYETFVRERSAKRGKKVRQ